MYTKIRHYRPDEVDELVEEETGETEESPYEDADHIEMEELVGHRVMHIEGDDD